MLVALNQFLVYIGAGLLRVKRLKVQKQLFIEEGLQMSKEDYQRLGTTAKEKKKERLAMGMETLAFTGARISELKFFTVERVKKGAIEIFNKGKRRMILLPDNLRKKLLYYAASHKIKKGRIFVTKSGGELDRSDFWREMKGLQGDAGVEWKKIYPHNLRRLFARLYYKKTKDLAGLADLLGHSSLDVTRIYTAKTEASYKRQISGLNLIIC